MNGLKTLLTGFGKYLVAALIGVVIALVFVAADLLITSWVSNAIQLGLAIFTAFTAYFALMAAQATQSGVKAQVASVIAARDAAEASRKGVQAQILVWLLSEYAHPEMQLAIGYIHSWWAAQPDLHQLSLLRTNPKEYRDANPSEWESLASACDRLYGFYENVYRLRQQTSLIDDVTAKSAVNRERAIFYLQYVEPLKWAMWRDYSKDCGEFYIKEYQFGGHRNLPFGDWWEQSFPWV